MENERLARDSLSELGAPTRETCAKQGQAMERGVQQDLQRQVQHDLSTGVSLTRWVGSIGLAVAVGVAYFVAARLSLALLTKPEGVAVFWPAAGVSAGVLIALGSTARWPVVFGTMAATIAPTESTANSVARCSFMFFPLFACLVRNT